MNAGTVVFLAVLVILAYHYVGYPLTLAAIAAFRRGRPVRPGSGTPTVTLVVSAYNEEDVLRAKLENALALDYPADRLEIVVASDGSTDRTVAIAREFSDRGVVVHEYRTNRGKNAALNDTVPQARGEIVVFTDANGMYRPDALRRLVAYFDDARVGSVCGELIYLNYSKNPVADGYGAYWRFDQRQKRLESDLQTLLGANGSIFAIRRRLYRPLPNTVCNDMVLPILVAAAGHSVVYAPDAVATEAGSADLREELRRRSRIIARGILGVRAVAGEVVAGRRWLLGWALLWRKASATRCRSGSSCCWSAARSCRRRSTCCSSCSSPAGSPRPSSRSCRRAGSAAWRRRRSTSVSARSPRCSRGCSCSPAATSAGGRP
jgi:cellulose synthase/poly-beta-1,6-N-acetylglucosamine synthase-like glycosyltransferase